MKKKRPVVHKYRKAKTHLCDDKVPIANTDGRLICCREEWKGVTCPRCLKRRGK